MSELAIWTALRSLGFTDAGAAGIMGNLQAESALSSINVEDRSGIDDQVYTNEVDNGTRTAYQWAHDSYGYGLAQWTYYTRKEKLLNYAKSKGVSIGDENMQVNFLAQELQSDYPNTYQKLRTTNSVADASYVMLTDFERPANALGQISYRQGLSQKFYDKYAGAVASSETDNSSEETGTTNTTPTTVIIKKGSKGKFAKAAQCLLNAHKSDGEALLDEDGDIGVLSYIEICKFQASRGLERDGVIGPVTWEELTKL